MASCLQMLGAFSSNAQPFPCRESPRSRSPRPVFWRRDLSYQSMTQKLDSKDKASPLNDVSPCERKQQADLKWLVPTAKRLLWISSVLSFLGIMKKFWIKVLRLYAWNYVVRVLIIKNILQIQWMLYNCKLLGRFKRFQLCRFIPCTILNIQKDHSNFTIIQPPIYIKCKCPAHDSVL